eukprot:2662388-Alexandrium_andersonii.AAC.1
MGTESRALPLEAIAVDFGCSLRTTSRAVITAMLTTEHRRQFTAFERRGAGGMAGFVHHLGGTSPGVD